MTGRVLVTDHVGADVDLERSLLESGGLELVVAPDTSEDTLIRLAAEVDALLVCYAQVQRRVVEAAGEGGVRVIARTGIGWDNIDVEAAQRAGITVTNVPDYCLDEVADHTVALLLVLARRIFAGMESVRHGGWEFPRGSIRRLAGRRLALIGVGQIGRRVAGRAAALGLTVVAYDPFFEDWASVPVERATDLHEALAEADLVSLHVPLTEDTHHLVDEPALAAMRRSPALVNTARGPLVDLDAVTAALVAGRLSGVALDVTDPEPLPVDHPLRSHPDAIVTPHMAFYSVESEDELRRLACEEVLRALAGDPPRSPVSTSLRSPRGGGG